MEKNIEEFYSFISSQSKQCSDNFVIDPELYDKLNVKRGLRDKNGNGVLAGLTSISSVESFKIENGEKIPVDGTLLYRGYNINDLVNGVVNAKRYGFEETAYLLLFGKLPNQKELKDFCGVLGNLRCLPTNFVRDVIMKAPSKDIMNTLTRSILTLASYDENAADNSIENVLRQCLMLISELPMLAVYGFHAYNHYECDDSMYIHRPDPELSTAENILRMLRPDMKYSHLEAEVLDIALMLHMEHGGGNNSTFTTHVVTSSGSDTYSVMAAALSSLKGPKHGGANIKVCAMFNDIKENVRDWNDEEEISAYLKKILHKEAFDKAGLIYGVGHAVYSVSDPRAEVFKGFVKSLSEEKGLDREYALYSAVERLAPEIIAGERKMYKGVSVNVDFYSGFVYDMLGLPHELYTPLFAIARIAGWSAHRIEELLNAGKIIRPAYMSVQPHREYLSMDKR